jgi:molybdopterin-guanine dinucleotide biosynthesis protein A
MADQPAIVAVLAGGLGRRLGGAKPSVSLAGHPLVGYPLRAAADAGLEAIVVAKRSTVLPPLDVEVLHEAEEPRHPLCGVIAALRFAGARPGPQAVLTLACDMPFLTGALLSWLAGREGAVMAQLDGRPQPLLARCPVEALAPLERALAERRSLRSALGMLAPGIVAGRELGRFGDPARLCFNVNDRCDLRTAQGWLATKAV